MRTPEPLLIVTLIIGELSRRFARRVRSGPLYRWRFAGAAPEALQLAPADMRPADPALANDYYSGLFEFAGTMVDTKGDSPFSVESPSAEWFTSLHSFRWMRHLRAAKSDLIEAHAAALVSDWITTWGNRLDSQAWRSDIIAARMISWFSHAPLIVKNTDATMHRTFLKSLSRQYRYLYHNAPSVRDGYPRLHAMVALCCASLCLGLKPKVIEQLQNELDKELKRQILPDGGHVSRNPGVLITLLADLLPLREAYIDQGIRPTSELMSAIDRMIAILRFFRHSNGDLAQFNGAGYTPAPLLSTVLRYEEQREAVQQTAPHSGYHRLSAGQTVVLMDTGKPLSRATARRAMAGTLSFELSSGSTRFITNCGIPDFSFKQYAPFARATAAHSTATVDNQSSSRFASDSRWHSYLPSPLIHSPQHVEAKQGQSEGYHWVSASHDGYGPRLNVIHRREIHLSRDGKTLNAIDRFSASQAGPVPDLPVTLRFHLPASISASALSSGHSILIASTGSSSDAWTFSCVDGEISLEESIQFSGPGLPRKTEQIVVHSTTGREEIRWTMVRRKPKAQRARKTGKEALPDFLDQMEIDTEQPVLE